MKMTGLTPDQVAKVKADTDTAAEISALEATLAATDWYVTRKAETGKDVPPEVLAGRQSARERISQLKALAV